MVQDDPKLPDDSGEKLKSNGVVGGLSQVYIYIFMLAL